MSFLLAVLIAVASGSNAQASVPDSMPYEGYAQAWDIAMHASKFEAAEKMAREGSAKFPDKFALHYMIGASLTAQHEDAAAFYEYQWELLRVGPDRPSGKASSDAVKTALTARGAEGDEIRQVVAALEGMEHQPARSVAALQDLLAHRDAFVLHLFLAEALVKANRPGEAIPIYRSLLKQDSYFVPGYVELSLLLRKSKKSASEGDALLAKAQSIDPGHWRLKGM